MTTRNANYEDNHPHLPFGEVEIVSTPKDWKQLSELIETHAKHYDDCESKARLYAVAFLTWNLAANLSR
tara:strand:- start:457 stop:663 length:207 start_codon:yes stop_codon:yes gene_type:complete